MAERDSRLRPGEAGFRVVIDTDDDAARAQVEAVIERALVAAGMRRLPPIRHLSLVRETVPARALRCSAYDEQPGLWEGEA